MTTRREIAAQLGSVWIFEGCSTRELGRVARLGTTRAIDGGKRLTTRGDTGRECFIVLDGRVRVERPGMTAKELGRGTCIGEMALVDGSARSATVTAITECEVFVVGRDDFHEFLAVAPTVAIKLIEALGLRLRTLERRSAPTRASTARRLPRVSPAP